MPINIEPASGDIYAPCQKCGLKTEYWDLDGGLCRRCRRIAARISKLPSHLQGCTLENFQGYCDPVAKMKQAITDFLKSDRGVFISTTPAATASVTTAGSSCGTGKTHLAAGVCIALAQADRSVVYTNIRILNTETEKIHNYRNEETSEDVVEKYAQPEYLIIDDLCGLPIISARLKNLVYEILDERYSRGKKKVLITSDKSLNDVAEIYGDRIPSRIMRVCEKFEFVGIEDWSLRKRDTK